MNAAFDSEPWHDLAIAVAGATAALAGLLVVAISINVREIVASAPLPRRAAGALITVTTPLIVSVSLLIPGQSRTALGIELVIIAAVNGALLPVLNWPGSRSPSQSLGTWVVGTGVPIALLILPTLVAGIGVLTASGGGLYWLVVAIIAAIVGGMAQAWVLLIEILR